MLIQTILLPRLSLAFEYKGEQHYVTNFMGSSSIRQRDQSKLKFASQLGITVISIPFWWNRSANSLAATIQSVRPDIEFQRSIPTNAQPIPLESLQRYKKLKHQTTQTIQGST
jgi:hypothetical protein